ncbi:hypothetical protein E5358_12715 [Palleniella muris]|uniref:Uncharacterized protein n=1 Tax=Palleniella muris TaxID=3038145 RepID=A0AC61QMH9_9BACT|nr:hypothetical protein [Palleniella muris]TGX80512.1 hypothetical protein E5358_12715 [Palleniella muris]
MQTIDFTAVFNAVTTEAEVQSLMAKLVEGALKAGHERIAEFGKPESKGKKKTVVTVETKAKEYKTTTERKPVEERRKERAAYIRACKPGSSVEVTVKDFRTKQDIQKSVSIPTKAQLKELDLKAVDYSESSFVVVGNTKEIKDYLKHILGGTFNPCLSCGAGWVFAKNVQGDAVMEVLSLTI